ncbi:MAG: hybrid sensor histidine kinase/response regulator [Candidatus Wallbacteria bacterium]|nr:hybrid sensor histidine kinase/response regulator [Candidatus Wallbacteria bacterium]
MAEEKRHSLLVVDDEKEITASLVGLFRREFRVIPANSAAEALEALEREEVHVLMTDQRMPGTTGTAFLASLADRHPDMVRILLTGYADVQAAIDAINSGQVYRYITKPWNPEELTAIVRQAVQRHTLIRERAQLITDLQAANEELRELDRVRRAFMEVAGHELKTPITVLLGYTHLIQSGCYGALPDTAKPALGNITKTLAHLNELVMRMLKLLKAQMPSGAMSWEELPLADVVRETQGMIQLFLDLRKQSLRVRLDPPDLRVRGDHHKLVDILVNLLTNSIKFSKDGAELELEAVAEPGGHVRVTVADPGVGISDEDLPHVFDHFFASFDVGHHSTGDYQFGRRGVGLGLAIVKRFVELHGGTLALQSKKDAGTRVSFTVPMARPTA